MKLTQERLKEVLDYDSETGVFTGLVARRGRATKGSVAGNLTSRGYIRVGVDGKVYKAHRLVWLYVYGYFPENEIDHIDRNPSNNKLSNLREVSHQCNMRNSKGRSNATSDVKGIAFRKGKWRALISIGNKMMYLGSFSSKSLAAKKRCEAEIKYGFITCDSSSEAKKYFDANPLTKEELIEEEMYKDKTANGGQVNNKTGITGVNWIAAKNCWEVRLQVRGEKIYLGSYTSKLEAAKARYAGEVKYGIVKSLLAKIYIENHS